MTHAAEEARLSALRNSGLVNQTPDPVLDDLVALASELCQAPIALITLLDEHTQWFKSAIGVKDQSTDRAVAFCNYTIEGNDLMVVPDAQVDTRFSQNPLVTGDPNIRFYAGYPLRDSDGFALGTLCVLDRKPRTLTAVQQETIRRLGRYAETEIERKRMVTVVAATNLELAHEIDDRVQIQAILRDMLKVQSEIVDAQLNSRDVLQLIVDRTHNQMGVNGVILELFEGEELTSITSSGTAVTYEAANLPFGGTLSGICLQSCLPFKGASAIKQGDHSDLDDGNRICSVLMIPINPHDYRRGVLTAVSESQMDFGTRQTQKLELMAGFIPQFITQAKEREMRADLVKERSAALEALREREELFEEFMNHSPAAAFMKDEEGRIIYINAAIKQIWNVGSADWEGRTDTDLWPLDIAAKIRAVDYEVLREWKEVDVIEQVPVPSGEIRSFRSIKFPFKDSQGRKLVGGMSLDVTASRNTEQVLRTSLAEKEVLVKEVHHRVKNNLQVISSLLNMQAQAVSDNFTKGLLQHNQSRVFAMALVHEELYKSTDLSQIEISHYLQQLLSYQASIYGAHRPGIETRFESNEEVCLSVDQAIPCGLIVNELISNSFKYAFPSSNGKVAVIVRRLGQDVTIVVQDNGVGLPDNFSLANSTSLGLELVQILRDQLQATLNVCGSPGATFSLCFAPIAP